MQFLSIVLLGLLFTIPAYTADDDISDDTMEEIAEYQDESSDDDVALDDSSDAPDEDESDSSDDLGSDEESSSEELASSDDSDSLSASSSDDDSQESEDLFIGQADTSDEESEDTPADGDDQDEDKKEATVPNDDASDSLSVEQAESSSEELAEIPSPEDEELGIDTLDLKDPSGNWLYKRIWWEKAEARYDKIKSAVNRILDARMYFFEQRVNLDRTLFDPFYKALGLSRGELQQAVADMIEQLKLTADKKPDKAIIQKVVIQDLQEEQEAIERLQKELDGISNIDHTIDDALTKLMNQINACRQYEQEAWQALRSIAREVSDKAARDHYYAMDSVWKNVKNVQNYLQGEFSQHFNELIQNAKSKTEIVTQTVNQLKEKGIDLKVRTQKALEPDEQAADDDEDVNENGDEESRGFFGTLIDILLWPLRKILALWHMIVG
jgi:hypothetical protein